LLEAISVFVEPLTPIQVYITGGIAAKNLDWITKKVPFLEIMLDKGRVSPALKRCPIKVVLADDCEFL
jgi:glucokinase